MDATSITFLNQNNFYQRIFNLLKFTLKDIRQKKYLVNMAADFCGC